MSPEALATDVIWELMRLFRCPCDSLCKNRSCVSVYCLHSSYYPFLFHLQKKVQLLAITLNKHFVTSAMIGARGGYSVYGKYSCKSSYYVSSERYTYSEFAELDEQDKGSARSAIVTVNMRPIGQMPSQLREHVHTVATATYTNRILWSVHCIKT